MSENATSWETYKRRIRERIDFVALVEEKVGPLRRRPTENSPVLVRCPWHDDHVPSLAVYPDHATCFGACGQTWDLFGWAMKVWNLDFPGACHELARRAGVHRPTFPPPGHVHRSRRTALRGRPGYRCPVLRRPPLVHPRRAGLRPRPRVDR